MNQQIFGIEPLIIARAQSVQQYDLLLVSDGKATPTLELVAENAARDPEDGNFYLIKLISQRTIKIWRGHNVVFARKGINQNQT